MEEEFIRNQEQMKPLEEKQEVSWEITICFYKFWTLFRAKQLKLSGFNELLFSRFLKAPTVFKSSEPSAASAFSVWAAFSPWPALT